MSVPTADSSMWAHGSIQPRCRVISDNDYSGDPDGLVQLAHHVLSPSVKIAFVIGSHLAAGDPFDPSPDTAASAAQAALDLLHVVGPEQPPVVAGSATGLTSRLNPQKSDAAHRIVAEAMDDSSELPLYVVCGAGLTEIASAWLIEPRIADRLTVIWIGGHEHEGLAEPPPNGTTMEYNLAIDPIAGQVVFNDSNLAIHQVPRDAYRTTLASRSELLVHMAGAGELGQYLFNTLAAVATMAGKHGFHIGETYIMGDSPLVLLTALLSSFEAEASSCRYVTMPCPDIDDEGLYQPNASGRPMRVYTQLDNRLMLDDLYAKLQLHEQSNAG